MRQLFALIRQLAPSQLHVLVLGERGTEKLLLARALHNLSAQRQGSFTSLDCSSLPQPLLEKRLFGPALAVDLERAAGQLQETSGGTLFLDEIDTLPSHLQRRLLRRLRHPLPSRGEVSLRLVFGVRELDPSSDLARGELLRHLRPVRLTLPPLRQRGSDVLLIAQKVLDDYATKQRIPPVGLSPAAVRALLAYQWPGNRQELEHCLQKAASAAAGNYVGLSDLGPPVRDAPLHQAAADPQLLVSLEEIERRYIQLVMNTVKGNKAQAARLLGLDRTTLYRKLDRYRYESSDTNQQTTHCDGLPLLKGLL